MFFKLIRFFTCFLMVVSPAAASNVPQSLALDSAAQPCAVTIQSKSQMHLTPHQIANLKSSQLSFLTAYQRNDLEVEMQTDDTITAAGLGCVYLGACAVDRSCFICGLLACVFVAKSACDVHDIRKARNDIVMKQVELLRSNYNQEGIRAFLEDHKKELHEDYQAVLKKALAPKKQKMA